MTNQYLVICKDDDNGPYMIASRRVFTTKKDAQDFATGISESREPIIVTSFLPIVDSLHPDEEGEQRVNADLLAALESLLQEIEYLVEDGTLRKDNVERAASILFARDAIKKAKGVEAHS